MSARHRLGKAKVSYRIPFNKPFIVGRELHYMAEAVVAGQIAGEGRFVHSCEQLLQESFGAGRILLTASCTSALEIAAMLCDLEPGDEVILPSYTFVSTANAFALQGARLVFVDIRPDTLNLDESLIEAAITDRSRVIVPVHYAGVPAEMEAINNIAEHRGLMVVEDAAQGVNASYHGLHQGTLGDFGCYSFHETKNFICGEGGALVVRDPGMIQRAECIRDNGTNRKQFMRGEVDHYEWRDVGSSYILPELLAAFLYAQLENMQHITLRREAMHNRYREALKPLEQRGDIRLPVIPGRCTVNYHMFYILLESEPLRAALIEYLKEREILAVFHYVSLHASPMGQAMGYRKGMLPVTEDVSERLLRLPMYFELTDAQIDEVAAAIWSFFYGEAWKWSGGIEP
jgi:dTDP-4-amino-4,6-dideoxygalactose transaminase